jgi:plastocyanin
LIHPAAALALAVCAALPVACGGSSGDGEPATQVLTLRVVTAPGLIEFDRKRLTARAGRVTFVLINEKRRGHNIRIQTGARCCFRPGSKDIGGTRTIGTGRTSAVVDLKPGVYTYLCSAGSHWHTQHGQLVVR